MSMTDSSDSLDLARAVKALRAGKLVACPTESVWGLSCDPDNGAALAQLMRVKGRDPAKGVIVVASRIEQLAPWLEGLPTELHAPLVDSWPGPNTWLVPDNGHSHGLVRGDHRQVALRVTAHPVMSALCDAFGGPLVSTSANPAGEPAAMSQDEVEQRFRGQLGAVVTGALGGNPRPSTIRDLVTGRILRP